MNLPAIANLSSSFWAQFGAALGNHLWQSTLFAGVVGLLTLLLRKNRADTRYSLWLIASAKFLLPFSLLIGMGSHLRWSNRPAITQPSIFAVTQVISEPFAEVNPGPAAARPAESPVTTILHAMPILLLTAWSCGCAAVVFFWWGCRRRMAAAKHDSSVVHDGRELETLRRLERSAQMAGPIELRISESMLEPGILGVFRPVLLLPAGISDCLSDAQLEAIITHELCHVRRRDNLAAAVHMLIEAVFWFHPLIWWIGARLVEERERACDEEVLRVGTNPQAYAEAILKICKFYVVSPLFSAAGVTGSNLKKRIEAIMIHRIASKLELPKKVLLGAVGMASVLGPVVFGALNPVPIRAQSQAQSTRAIVPSFEAVTIKPNKTGEIARAIGFEPDRFMATNVTLHGLIAAAYAAAGSEILGGPDWVRSKNYDVEAKLDTPVIDELSTLGPDQRLLEQKRILQALLADRFRLALHREKREPPAYVLAIAKDGLKLQEAKPGDTYPDGFKDPEGRPLGAGALLQPGPCKLVGQGVHMADLAKTLSMNYLGGQAVIDQTSLSGVYDFTLDCHTALMERGESVLTVLPEQLGLELKPLDVLVIDHAEEITGGESIQTQQQDQGVAESLAASMPPARVYESVSIRSNQSTTAFTPAVEFRPNGFTATNVTLQMLIQQAYGVEAYQIAGAPAWLDRDRYDVEAKVDDSVADELSKGEADRLSAEQQPMLFELLADHFLLSVHRETRELPTYALVIAKNGSKLHQATPGDTYPNGISDSLGNGHGDIMRMLRGQIIGQGVSLDALVQPLSHELGRTVLNRTGLTGKYDCTLQWSDGRILARRYIVPGGDSKHVRLDPPPSTNAESRKFSGPSIFAALHDQLGLELVESHEQSSPAQILVIDRAEKPSEN